MPHVTDAHERGKDFLDPAEIDRLLAAAKDNRHGVRDSLLLLMSFGMDYACRRPSSWRLDALNLKQSSLWVKRIKNSLSTQQPISGDACDQTLSGHPLRPLTLGVRVRARPRDDTSGGKYIIKTAGERAGLGHVLFGRADTLPQERLSVAWRSPVRGTMGLKTSGLVGRTV